MLDSDCDYLQVKNMSVKRKCNSEPVEQSSEK